MDAEKRTEVLVGVVVVFGLVALVLGLIWGEGLKVFEKRHELTVHFSDVRGLEPGDPVMIRGLKKGEVESIVLFPDFVEVRLWVKGTVELFEDLLVCVEDRELMGGKKMTLFPGTVGRAADFNRIYQGTARSDMMLLMLKVERVLSRADTVFMQMHRLAENAPVGALFDRVESTLAVAEAMVQENRSGMGRSMRRLDGFTAQLEADSTAQRIGRLTGGLNRLTGRMDSTLTAVRALALQMQDSSGTAGRMLSDAALYHRMVTTVSSLDSLIVDVKRNPKKYLKVSVF